MRIANYLFVLICSLSLVGCGNTPEEATACQNPLVPVEVDLQLEDMKVGQVMTISAFVSHDGIPVDNANEVVFEIWEHGNEEYHFIEETINVGEGLYSLNWTFEKEGVYYVYYHVTACDMHRMEKHQIVIGDVNVEQIISEPDIDREVHGYMNNKHNHHHNH